MFHEVGLPQGADHPDFDKVTTEGFGWVQPVARDFPVTREDENFRLLRHNIVSPCQSIQQPACVTRTSTTSAFWAR